MGRVNNAFPARFFHQRREQSVAVLGLPTFLVAALINPKRPGFSSLSLSVARDPLGATLASRQKPNFLQPKTAEGSTKSIVTSGGASLLSFPEDFVMVGWGSSTSLKG